MSWFQLDAKSIVERATKDPSSPTVPSLAASVVRGVIGFKVVSIAGFAPWAVGGRWLYRHMGEAGMYGACAGAFIGLSGLLLHPLIIGVGSLSRFYKLFSIAFAGYAIAWMVGWMLLHGDAGSIVGLLAGTAVMGFIFARAFDASRELLKIIAMLFVLNTLGYYIGGWVEGAFSVWKDATIFSITIERATRSLIAKLLWGACYGMGFGAGLGLAFYFCQTEARALLKKSLCSEETYR